MRPPSPPPTPPRLTPALQDPSCRSYSQALLYFKGYHAIQAQRIAHCLWHRSQKVMALAMQVGLGGKMRRRGRKAAQS